LCQLERETFGVDHQEVGYVIAMKWRLPGEFSTVIREHHERPDGRVALLDLVRAANAFVNGPRNDLGVEGIILQKEADRIAKETNRIGKLLGVVDARA
jgi:HD-like signal output (HDOD) protein